jgi:hypothetical protein
MEHRKNKFDRFMRNISPSADPTPQKEAGQADKDRRGQAPTLIELFSQPEISGLDRLRIAK